MKMNNPNVAALRMSFAKKLEWKVDSLKDMHPIDSISQIEIVSSEIQTFILPWKSKPQMGKKGFSKVKWYTMWTEIDLIFGEWSHLFNSILRKKIKEYEAIENRDKNEEILLTKFRYVYAFWWNTYHLINEVFKMRTNAAGKNARKHILKGRKTLKGLIDGTINLEYVHQNFKELVGTLNQDDYLSKILFNNNENKNESGGDIKND